MPSNQKFITEWESISRTPTLSIAWHISTGIYNYSSDKVDILSASIVLYCIYIRNNDRLPKTGCRELYELCRQYFKERFTIGRGRFYNILHSNNLMLRKKRYRPRTTDSGHGYRIYDDLLNTSTKFIQCRNGSLVVCDITYIYTTDGFAYLTLVKDAYSRFIVGYSLNRTLEVDGLLKAINQAIETYHSYGIGIEGMIHHSDRGVQYASKHIQICLNQTI